MSRWGKNIVVPLESLIKEKENTNRPTAARSAGTVGKWGKMGFTSTRTYALKALPAAISPAQSPQGGDCQLTPTHNDPPKPKKFFKSRNSVADIIQTQIIHHLPRAPPSPIREQSNSTYKETSLKIKISKPPSARERKKSTTVEKPIKIKKKKEEERKLKPEAPPTRRISRNRKVVNYNEEDDDRSQTPLRDLISVLPPETENIVIKEPPPPSVPKPPLPIVEHPPIVLRISKGTSRLVSTDSEGPLNSPAHEAPIIEPPTPMIVSSATELPPYVPTEEPSETVFAPPPEVPEEEKIAKLEEIETTAVPPEIPETSEIVEPIEKEIEERLKVTKITTSVIVEPPTTTVQPPPPPPKLESLKIVIKTDILKASSLHDKPEKKKSKKHHRRSSSALKIIQHQFKTPSPQPGNENFEVYRSLAISPSERDFDSQSSILGSISSKETSQFPVAIPDESCVIRSRGSSDVTSDLETSQHSSLVAPPSDIESRLESMMDCDDDDAAGIAASLAAADESERIGNQTDEFPDDFDDNNMNLTPPIQTEETTPEDILKILSDEPIAQNEDDEDHMDIEEPTPPVPTAECVTECVVEPETEPVTEFVAEEPEEEVVPPKRLTRARKNVKPEPVHDVPIIEEEPTPKEGRITRNNNNGVLKNKKPPPPIKSYSRKRKLVPVEPSEPVLESIPAAPIADTDTTNIDLLDAPLFKDLPVPENNEEIDDNQILAEPVEKEYKIKNKFKRTWYEREAKNHEEDHEFMDDDDHGLGSSSPPQKGKNNTFNPSTTNSTLSSRNALRSSKIVNNNNDSGGDCEPSGNDDEKRSVKLVISKKKGSIFKSRALIADQGDSKKRHVYKHTWDAEKEKPIVNDATNPSSTPSTTTESSSVYDDFNNVESTSTKLTRLTRQNVGKFEDENVTTVKCDRKAKEYYTVVRNVKTAHQIQEIGEYQEMDDDVEYILDALQPHNPIPTRCLSAIQLASKCMTPAFRMHVRAHGTVTKFFKALKDAKNDLSLGLCTATIMFVLSQDTLNMDLDRDSLELMMNLLEADICDPLDDKCSAANFDRNKQKVKEICEEIKSQGKAAHLNLDSISTGTLAMETLLSLTSKRAGEWFKEELRELGGLEHIIKTICDCCHQISDYVVNWTETLLDKLRTIERCLRVLENVSQQNEKNQHYILSYSDGNAVNTLVKLYKLCDSEIALYPTTDTSPKENPGVVLREALVPTLKVLINLTHPFDDRAVGSAILGDRDGIFDTSFHILLQAPFYIPERCIFELSILVLLLLINLTMHTLPNRMMIMQSHAPTDAKNQFEKVPAIKALIEYFYKCEEQARLVEKNTDAILENPDTTKKKVQSQEELDETVTKLLQKAGHHMEHTMQASYAGILMGHLMSGNEEYEKKIRSYLHDSSFKDIVSVLDKYYNFMNLTASSEATVVSHIKSTKKLIDFLKKCDQHSNSSNSGGDIEDKLPVKASTSSGETTTSSSSVMSTRSTPRVYKTYSQRFRAERNFNGETIPPELATVSATSLD